MMAQSLIWLHGEALRKSHPVFKSGSSSCEAVYIWDDVYLQSNRYSLKRLVFLYETLCDLDITIVQADTEDYLRRHSAQTILMPSSHDPCILAIANRIAQQKNLLVVPEEVFVDIEPSGAYRRFFHYWNEAKKTAFKRNAGLDD